MARSRVLYLVAAVALLAVIGAAVLWPRPNPVAEINAAFAQYQTALASGDAQGVMAVTSPDSVTYFGEYLRDHALRRTREEMKPRSVWEQYCILVYRDQLGAPFLRKATAAEVYAELVRRHLLLFEVKDQTLGQVRIEGKSAEAALLKDGKPRGTTILFDGSRGGWSVLTHSNVGYAIAGLREIQERGDADREEFVRQLFERFRGKPLDDALWDPPGP